MTLYLSRLILNPRSKAVQRDLNDPYEMHRTVMNGFPDDLPRDEERVLHRLDQDHRRNRLSLLVQSQGEPDWGSLPEGYLMPLDPLDPVADNPAVRTFEPVLHAGQVLSFRLVGNPMKRLGKSAGKDKGKRVGLYKTEEQVEWLAKKGKCGGFQLLSVLPSQESVAQSKRLPKLLTVQFDGQLQITEPEAFHQTLANGIGRAKAFGCGLLSLAPAR